VPKVRTLRIGISGVRGVVGDSLTPQLLMNFAQAFGTYLGGGEVAIGRDTRPSGEMALNALVGGLLAVGCSVVDLGIVPVPSLQIAVARNPRFDGGIAITASHNPQEWNALKFIRSDGIFLYPHQAEELLNVYHQGEFALVGNEEIGVVTDDSHAIERHIAEVIARTDTDAIRAAKLSVVVDCVNGAGALASRQLLEQLGCAQVWPINDTPDGIFPRKPEPVPENLCQLGRAVKQYGADIGFAQDADADRLAIVSDEGVAIGEEFTLALASEAVVSKQRLPLVCNLSTSRMMDEVARRHSVPIYRTPVGEINVVDAMREAAARRRADGLVEKEDQVFGGEGNGGIIDPRIHYCRDSLRGMALILEGLARRGGKLSEWASTSFEPSAIVKVRHDCPSSRIQSAMLAIRHAYQDQGQSDDRDGLKVVWPDGDWLHVRPSNTEPIIRIVAEADTEAQASAICAQAAAVVSAAI
jgi:phosphomannomutase